MALLESVGPSRVQAAKHARIGPIPRSFRPDIQGLRAVAVLLVVLYHAHVPGLGAGYVGVDVFFVISGFLITGHLIREVQNTGPAHFLAFYLQRARRLLPAAILVAVVTLLAARAWAPLLQVKSLGTDAMYVALYALNYRLAQQGIDYQQAQSPESPLQHYWSLGVEEQFYLLWPLLLMGCVLLGQRMWKPLLVVVLGAGVIGSLVLSEQMLGTNGPLAYFSVQSRAWELGVGALVALAANRLATLSNRVGGIVSWAGLVMVAGSAVVYSDSTAFPGCAALMPVAGAALIIAAGCASTPRVAEALLGRRVMQGLGKVSYPWYLWHWPMVILMPFAFGYEPTWWRNLEMMVVALWLAVLTHWLLENPIQRLRLLKVRWAGATVAMSCMLVAVSLLVLATIPVLTGQGAQRIAVTTDIAAGAGYLVEVHQTIDDSINISAIPSNLTPDLASAAHDLPGASDPTFETNHCQAQFLVVEQGDCLYGDISGAQTMVLFGDSHAEQWEPAFAEAGKRQGWRVINWTKNACPAGQLSISNPQLNRQYTECDQWRERTLRRIADLEPDLVVISQSDSVTGNSFTDEQYASGVMETVGAVLGDGIPVTYLADIMYPQVDVPSCLAQHLDDARQCGRVDTASFTDSRRAMLLGVLADAGVPVVDPTSWQCTADGCPAIVGNMMVYRDASHLTATYSKWLAPLVQPMLATG